MEGLKETGKPNLIDANGGTLRDFEDSKRGEILAYIKSNRGERDSLLEKASSLKIKVRDFFGGNEGESLKSQAGQIDQNLRGDIPWKHWQIKEDLDRKARGILTDTVSDPLSSVNRFYYMKRNLQRESYQTENSESFDELSLKVEEKKIEATFKKENVVSAFGDKDMRKEMYYILRIFFDSNGSNPVFDNIERPEPYSFKNATGFPIEVAKSALTGLQNAINKEGIDTIEDDPSLFRLLNNLAFIHPDGYEEKNGNTILKFASQKILQLDMYKIASSAHLVRLISEGSEANEFKLGLEAKLNSLVLEKDWGSLGAACLSYSEEISVPALQKLDESLQTYGLSLSDVRRAWDLYPASGDSSRMNVDQNMEKIQELEKERPGIVKTLYSDFGIKEFRRYPIQVLVEQFDQKDTDMPYGMVLFTNRDHNQSFDIRSQVIQSVFDKTTEMGMGMRITEFQSRYEIMKRFASLDGKYGEKNKISYVFLGAHGEEDAFQVTHTKEVIKNDLENEGVKRLKEYLVDRPEIIMASCSTGAENGIGQKISETYGAIVHAPNMPTSVRSVDVEFSKDGKPHFKVTYADDVLRTYDTGIKR